MNGYSRIPNELMRCPDLQPIAKVVWSLIAGMSPGFNATLNQFCTMVACHPNTWRRTIKMLERYGMISVEHSPNGVTYTAITDTSKWRIEGNKNCNPNKICEGNKNCKGEGNKICNPKGNKNCNPSEEQLEEQKKNILVETRTRIREEVMTDAMVEMGCMSLGIDRGTYENLAYQVFTDWDFQALPDSEWNKSHFLAVMRIKANIKRNEQRATNQSSGDPGDKLDRDAVKAMAALAAQSQQPVEPTW